MSGIITLGIGAASSLTPFLTSGLGIGEVAAPVLYPVTLYIDQVRSTALYVEQAKAMTLYIDQERAMNLELY